MNVTDFSTNKVAAIDHSVIVSIGKALKHTYKAMCHSSYALLRVMYVIQNFAKSTLIYFFSNAEPSSVKLNEKNRLDLLLSDVEESLESISGTEYDSNIKHEIDIELMAKEKEIIPPILPPSGEEIDVPDNGNCVFYALSIGLNKKFDSIFLLQNGEKWNVNPNDLRGNLSQNPDLLDEPAAFLRKQAADYLEKHINDEMVMNTLVEGIDSHKEAIQRKINAESSAETIVFEDLRILTSRNLNISDNWNQFIEKVNHGQIIRQSIEFEKSHLPENDDFISYIDATRQDKVYGGIPQIYAICLLYDISICVCYNYANVPYVQIYNEKFADTCAVESSDIPLIENPESKKEIPPLITLNFVNGNHFTYTDD